MDKNENNTPSSAITTFRPRDRASRGGTLRFGEHDSDCYTMHDGRAFLGTRGFMLLVAGTESGNLRRTIERISARSKAFSLEPELEFHPPDNNSVVTGYSTEAVITICARLVAMFFAGELHPSQHEMARRAGSILGAFANDGLRRAVWAATGFVSAARDYSADEKIAAVLRMEAGPWKRLFKPEFFIEMAKLYRVDLGDDGHRPMCFARFLSEFFYEWFDGDVYAEIKRRNPRPAKGSNHHQLLTPETRQCFERHHRDVLLLMRASESLSDFRMRFNAALRGQGLQMMLLAN